MLPTIYTDDLGPTATYRRRSFVWFGAVDGNISHRSVLESGEVVDELIPALGKLTIKVQHAKGYGCKCEVDTYAVEEVESEQLGAREFVFLNLSDPTQREPYRVTVGGVNRCRCICGIVNRYECKHFAAAARCLEAGVLDGAAVC